MLFIGTGLPGYVARESVRYLYTSKWALRRNFEADIEQHGKATAA